MLNLEESRYALAALLVSLTIVTACWGSNLTEPQQKVVAAIEGKLLAPCCYKETLNRHQSEIAVRMRLEIERMVEQGMREPEIVEYYVRQYGGKVVAVFAPTPEWAQYLPWLLTLAGALAIAWWIHRTVHAHAAAQTRVG
jgi:cytochrome c-type biogenesis protein CcmH/NrfF